MTAERDFKTAAERRAVDRGDHRLRRRFDELANFRQGRVFRRLAVVLVFNGVALCLFGITQQLTSPQHQLYWTYPTLGQVFGPFVSRNLFPYYVNVCLLLALGLFFARRTSPTADLPLYLHGTWLERQGQVLVQSVREWLQDPPSLWLLAAVAFMASTVAFTLSRGGCLALVAGLAVALLAGRRRGASLSGAALSVLLGALVLFFLAWLGLPLVESRLRTLESPGKADVSRWACWQRVLPGVAQCPQFPRSGHDRVQRRDRQPGADPPGRCRDARAHVTAVGVGLLGE